MSTYAKAIIATLTAIATWGVTAGADGNYSQVELWGLLGVVAAAVAVYAVPNKPSPTDPPVGPLNP
jgi:steroid 5-alpha reductase family enzyme